MSAGDPSTEQVIVITVIIAIIAIIVISVIIAISVISVMLIKAEQVAVRRLQVLRRS